METIRRMVPKTTLTYFSSEAGKNVIERIKLEDKIKKLQEQEAQVVTKSIEKQKKTK